MARFARCDGDGDAVRQRGAPSTSTWRHSSRAGWSITATTRLVVAGTTGESPTLTHDEQIELVATVAEAVDVPVVAGTGSATTPAAAIELT